MRFSDKLAKQRKSNNLSQEQLADKLGVTRQSISKWESGSSYPDMEKIIQICNILNCNLEDIMDDGVVKESTPKDKNTINNVFNEFIDYITKTFNMFSNMKFIDIIKCIIEFAIIGLVFLIIGSMIVCIIDNSLYQLFNVSVVTIYILNVIITLIELVLLIVSIIAMLHIFKIRYLDYYVTVPDKNVTEQIIEEPIEKVYNGANKNKEKIIIRDPKHTTSSFVNVLGVMVLYVIKFFFLMFSIPFIFGLIISISLVCISIYYISVNIISAFLLLTFIGSAALCYVFFNFIYNFIVERKNKLSVNFIIIVSSFVLIGAGVGLASIQVTKFDVGADNNSVSYKAVKEVIPESQLYRFDLPYDFEYVIDEKYKDVTLEVECPEYMKCYIGNNSEYYYINYYPNSKVMYKQIITDIKDNIIRDYDNNFINAKIYTNQANYDKIQINK